jgi:hypothetical protein
MALSVGDKVLVQGVITNLTDGLQVQIGSGFNIFFGTVAAQGASAALTDPNASSPAVQAGNSSDFSLYSSSDDGRTPREPVIIIVD